MDQDPDRPPRSLPSLRERYKRNRDFDVDLSWRDWLRHRYLKSWYGIGCLVLDGMVVGVVLQYTDASQVWPYLLSIGLVVALVYVELIGLRRFWPPKSPRNEA